MMNRREGLCGGNRSAFTLVELLLVCDIPATCNAKNLIKAFKKTLRQVCECITNRDGGLLAVTAMLEKNVKKPAVFEKALEFFLKE